MNQQTKLRIAIGVVGAFLLGFLGLIIFALITDTKITLIGIGSVIAVFGLFWAAMVIGDEL